MFLSIILILLLTILLTLFDIQTRRVPNWVTLPLLAAGMVAHFPSTAETWLGCLFLFLAWRSGWLGGGDAKLWMALLWLVPGSQAQAGLLVMGAALILTALVQLLWRKAAHRPAAPGPGAWRAIPFVVWLWLSR